MENHEFLWTQVKTECISPPTLTDDKGRKMSFMVEKPSWPTLTEGLILTPSAMDEAGLCAVGLRYNVKNMGRASSVGVWPAQHTWLNGLLSPSWNS